MATTKRKKKLPIDMYGRSMSKYADGGFSSANRSPDPVIIPSLPAGTIQDLEYQKYLAKINSEGIEKVAKKSRFTTVKTTNTTGDAIGAIGGIAGGFWQRWYKASRKRAYDWRYCMQAAGAVAPIATNPCITCSYRRFIKGYYTISFAGVAHFGIPKQNKYNRIEKEMI